MQGWVKLAHDDPKETLRRVERFCNLENYQGSPQNVLYTWALDELAYRFPVIAASHKVWGKRCYSLLVYIAWLSLRYPSKGDLSTFSPHHHPRVNLRWPFLPNSPHRPTLPQAELSRDLTTLEGHRLLRTDRPPGGRANSVGLTSLGWRVVLLNWSRGWVLSTRTPTRSEPYSRTAPREFAELMSYLINLYNSPTKNNRAGSYPQFHQYPSSY